MGLFSRRKKSRKKNGRNGSGNHRPELTTLGGVDLGLGSGGGLHFGGREYGGRRDMGQDTGQETPTLDALSQGLGGAQGLGLTGHGLGFGPAFEAHRTLTDRDVKKRKQNSGASAHDVQQVKFKKKLEGTDTKRGFFKSDPDKELAASAISFGIGQDEGDSRMAARAVASSRLDQMLGTNVLSEDRFAELGGDVGVVSPQVAGKAFQWTEWGDLAGGWDSGDLDHYERMGEGGVDPSLHRRGKKGRWEQAHVQVDQDKDLSNPETQRGLADLQLNDYLSGQVDRHSGNVFIDDDGQVKGIDNDMAFGTRDVLERTNMGEENQIHNLPEQIDRQTAESFLSMSEQDFVTTIAGSEQDPSRLSQFEVDAAVGRYWTLRSHVQKLADDDALIEEWNQDTYDAAVNADLDEGPRSYLQRMQLSKEHM